jgi:methionyl-tRNA formyltransferase
MRIIFIGTAEFGVPALEKIINDKENIVKVITQPDRPRGRGKKILPSPIKKVALERGIETFQPKNINEDNFIKTIKEFSPDIFLVVAYGQILSKQILDIPKMGCINIHASLLPKYRGPAPINWVIINGEKETGITFMYMNERVDAGDIIYQQKINILADETYGELSKRLSDLSAGVINKVLKDIKNGKVKKIHQDKQLVSYTKKMNKQDGEIIWNDKGEKIYNKIKGTIPYPGAYTYYHGRKLKITQARLLSNYKNEFELGLISPGNVIKIEKDSILISTGNKGIIKLLRMLPAGAKELSATQFVNGYKIKVGNILGN